MSATYTCDRCGRKMEKNISILYRGIKTYHICDKCNKEYDTMINWWLSQIKNMKINIVDFTIKVQ